MSPRNVTAMLVISLILLLVLFDFVIYARGGSEATISRVILRWAIGWPFVPFMAGLLCGHLFWSQDLTQRSQTGREPVWLWYVFFAVAALCLVVLAATLGWLTK